MIGQNYAKTPCTVVASQEGKDTSMEGSGKRSLSESSSPTCDGILRTGPKHVRAYKSAFTTPVLTASNVPVEAASQLPEI